MAKMSEKRKIEKGIIPPKPEPRKVFNEAELTELNALISLVACEKFKAIQIKGNTALIPDGQKYCEQQEAVARLMENVKQNWVSQKLTELGYEKGLNVQINGKTGEIILEVKPEEKK